MPPSDFDLFSASFTSKLIGCLFQVFRRPFCPVRNNKSRSNNSSLGGDWRKNSTETTFQLLNATKSKINAGQNKQLNDVVLLLSTCTLKSHLGCWRLWKKVQIRIYLPTICDQCRLAHNNGRHWKSDLAKQKQQQSLQQAIERGTRISFSIDWAQFSRDKTLSSDAVNQVMGGHCRSRQEKVTLAVRLDVICLFL